MPSREPMPTLQGASKARRPPLSLFTRWLMQDAVSYATLWIPPEPGMPTPFGTLQRWLPHSPKVDGLTLTRWLRGTQPMTRKKRTSCSTGKRESVKRKTSVGLRVNPWRMRVALAASNALLKAQEPDPSSSGDQHLQPPQSQAEYEEWQYLQR